MWLKLIFKYDYDATFDDVAIYLNKFEKYYFIIVWIQFLKMKVNDECRVFICGF
jgi:hypothetical protein